MVPPLNAQPFVENAIEHGMIYRIENGSVKIKIENRGELIVMTIEDNGVGSREMELKSKNIERKKKSLATQITRERLNYISKASKKQLDLVVNSLQSGGTVVTINLPKITAA